MRKLLVSFWCRESWGERPVACLVWLGLIFGLGGFALKYASWGVAAGSMTTLSVEERILETIEQAVGPGVGMAKAETAVKDEWPFPQCDMETPEERFQRLAVAVLCFDAKLAVLPSAEDLKKAIGELKSRIEQAKKEEAGAAAAKRLEREKQEPEELLQQVEKLAADRAGILEAAKTTKDSFRKEFEAKKAQGGSWTGMPQWSASCTPLKQWQEYGPETKACATELNDSATFPVTTASMIKALLSMELSPLSFKDSAQPFVGAEDEGGWDLFPGGELLQPYGPYRESIQTHLTSASGSEEPFRVPTLRKVAAYALSEAKNRTETAEKAGEAVRDAGYAKFTGTVKYAAFLFLFFVALSVFWAASRRAVGWRRLVGYLGLVLVAITLMAPGALEALDLKSAKDAIGQPDGLGSVLGAPFALVAQFVDLLQGWLASLWDFETVKKLILVGLFGLVFLATRSSVVVLGAYGLLVAERWFASGLFGVLPFDIQAFDAAVLPPIVGWLAQLFGFAIAVLLVRGMWRVIGEPMVRKGTGLLVLSASRPEREEAPEVLNEHDEPESVPDNPGGMMEVKCGKCGASHQVAEAKIRKIGGKGKVKCRECDELIEISL